MNYLGDKPSSRVLRPPGGGGSNIFGREEPAKEKKVTNPKSYQASSIFAADPLPEKPASTRHSVDTASNIFGGSPADSKTVSPKKVSKTHQSSIFSEPEPIKQSNAFKNGTHRISNIPMFTSTGPPESRRPVRRPLTAPPGHSPYNSVAHTKGTSYAADVKPDVGQKTKIRTGYKTANANLRSTVFNLKPEDKQKKRIHGDIKPNFFQLPNHPIIRSRPVRPHEKSSIFSKDDITQIKTGCQTRPISATYQSSAYESTLENSVSLNNSASGQVESALWSADDNMARISGRKCCKNIRNISSSVFCTNDNINKASVPIWSADDRNAKCKASRSLAAAAMRMNQSPLFQNKEETSYNAPLWSSDFKSAPRCPARKPVMNATYKSTVFSPERMNASLPRTVNSCQTKCLLPESTNEKSNQLTVIFDGSTLEESDIELISQNFPKNVTIEKDGFVQDISMSSSELQT